MAGGFRPKSSTSDRTTVSVAPFGTAVPHPVKHRLRLVLGEIGGEPVEMIGTAKEFVLRFAEPCLSSQVSKDFSHIPTFLRLRGRQTIVDHVDFPQPADQPRKRG